MAGGTVAVGDRAVSVAPRVAVGDAVAVATGVAAGSAVAVSTGVVGSAADVGVARCGWQAAKHKASNAEISAARSSDNIALLFTLVVCTLPR